MEERCRKKRLKALFKHSNKKPTTPSASGRSGWRCERESWIPISTARNRPFARQWLKELLNHLQSSAAIRRWITEEEET